VTANQNLTFLLLLKHIPAPKNIKKEHILFEIVLCMIYKSCVIKIQESGIAYVRETLPSSIKPKKIYDPFRNFLDLSLLSSLNFCNME